MKLIQRYVSGIRNTTAAAGVYTSNSSTAFTPQFNIIVNVIFFGAKSYDTVTSQAIKSMNEIRWTGSIAPYLKDNPGVRASAGGDAPNVLNQAGKVSRLDLHKSIGATDLFTAAFFSYLESVTANSILTVHNYTIGYLCPEDYLSVDVIK